MSLAVTYLRTMRFQIPTAAASLVLLAVSACEFDRPLSSQELSGHAMGTTYSIVLVDPDPDILTSDLRLRLQEKLEYLENIASTFRTASEISEFNLNETIEWVDVSKEFCTMVSDALEMGRQTGGAFDITVGPLVNLWGFGPDESPLAPPADSDIAITAMIVGYSNLEADCDRPALRKSIVAIQIDLSGWAKGYAVDQLSQMLMDTGVDNFFVELGGEIRVQGHNADNRRFAIAIERPSRAPIDENSIMRVSNMGIATSGDYRNFFEYEGVRYSHTIDPRTGRPVDHDLSAVTVVHESTAYADAMATALLVLGSVEGMALANELGIAAYFAVSTSSGFEFQSSAAFSSGGYFANQASM